MLRGAIDFPDEIISALKDDNLVVFAGAGVSMGPPANLMDFELLAAKVAEGTSYVRTVDQSVDQFLGHLESNKIRVRERVKSHLQPSGHNALHSHIVRLFKSANKVRIVTTNFEQLFESACNESWQNCPKVYVAPALPLGNSFDGIVHVHGSLTDLASLVLTDADFGRAYLTEGWVRRFLTALFQKYTVLFVGYSHKDAVLTYLARALPPTTNVLRYSLVQERDDLAHWRHLGIEPIPFFPHESGDFFNLDHGVQKLSEFRQQGVLEWERDIRDIAAMQHPLPRDKHDHLNQLLREEWAVRLFAKHARSVEWLTWLQSEGHITQLFKPEVLGNCALEFARTLPKHFTLGHSQALQLLCAQNNLILNQVFWHSVARELSHSETPPESNVFCSWLVLLLSCDTGYRDPHMLGWLAKRAGELNLPWCLLEIYEAMCHSSLRLKSGVHLLEPEEGIPPPVSMHLDLKSDWGSLHDIWEQSEPHLDELAEPLARLLIAELEKRFRMYVYYGTANTHWDPDCISRAAIAPHNQDKFPRPVHAMIDALRDSLHRISACRNDMVLPLARTLGRSRAPLLRRLAVDFVSDAQCLSSENKLKWLLEELPLEDNAYQHELFRLLSNSFPTADGEHQRALVSKILAIPPRESETDKSNRHLQYFQYSLLSHLQNFTPNCGCVEGPLARLRELHPEWKPSAGNVFSLTIPTNFIRHIQYKSPWSMNDLLSKSAVEWVDELLAYQANGNYEELDTDTLVEESREGLWGAITQASDERAEWGVEIAQILVDRAEWETDLWFGLLDSWAKWNGDKDTIEARLHILTQRELLKGYSLKIARLLRAFVEALVKEGNPSLVAFLDQISQVSFLLWPLLSIDLKVQNLERDWIQFAINEPGGILTEFWIRLHSHIRNSDDIAVHLNCFEQAFQSVVVDDRTYVGGAGRAILFRHLSYIQNALPIWTRDCLIPMLSSADSSTFRQAWHGVLSSSQVTDVLWAEIRDAVLNATSRLDELTCNGDSPGVHRFSEEFTDFFVDCVATFESDPVSEWIPNFYQQTGEDFHVWFARRVSYLLEQSSEDERKSHWQRWLQVHWKARLQGIPKALHARESGVMLNWLLYLDFDFSSAVDIACETLELNIESSNFFWDLGESELPAEFPEDTSRLVIHILELQSESREYTIYDLSKVLNKLLPNLEQDTLRNELHERVVICGLSWPDGDGN